MFSIFRKVFFKFLLKISDIKFRKDFKTFLEIIFLSSAGIYFEE